MSTRNQTLFSQPQVHASECSFSICNLPALGTNGKSTRHSCFFCIIIFLGAAVLPNCDEIAESGRRAHYELLRASRIFSFQSITATILKVTECEIFLSLLLKFLESDKLGWQRAIALDVLHKIVVQPHLLRYSDSLSFLFFSWFSLNYDERPNATKVVEGMMHGLQNYIQASFTRTSFSSGERFSLYLSSA